MLNINHCAFSHGLRGGGPHGLPSQAQFAKEIALSPNGTDSLLALAGRDGQFYFPISEIVHTGGGIALRKKSHDLSGKSTFVCLGSASRGMAEHPRVYEF